MIIEKILKQLTPERVKKEVETVQKIKLPPELQKWVKEYEKVGERDEFLWKWLYSAFKVVYLTTISKKFRASLPKIKVLLTIFITIVNDAGDKRKEKLLKQLIKISVYDAHISFTNLNKKDKQTLIFAKKIWNYVMKKIKKYPRYKEFKDILFYDFNQVINGINYSWLVNNNLYLINKTEYWAYMFHKMMAMVYTVIDLMVSPRFNKKFLAKIREIILISQKMARIGNWLSTWEREIRENDFTSGVFAYAIDTDVITVDDLTKEDKFKIVNKIKKVQIEKKLLKEWEDNYLLIKKLGKKILAKKIQGFNLNKSLQKLEKFIIFHLTSKGYK